MNQQEKQKLFDDLVENALDFIEHSSHAIEHYPKISLIHFCIAMELFMKARLLHEHWTLIIRKRECVDYKAFKKGDFVSISLDEAIERIGKTTHSLVRMEKIRKELSTIQRHRNKIIHFFHDAYTDEDTQKEQQTIVKEQLKTWRFVKALLLEDWYPIFQQHDKSIEEKDKKLRQSRKYLEIIYEEISSKIENEKKKGIAFETCPLCSYPALENILFCKVPVLPDKRYLLSTCNEDFEIYNQICWVCGSYNGRYIKLSCPSCHQDLQLKADSRHCQTCEQAIDLDEVCQLGHSSLGCTTLDNASEIINCGLCNGKDTVVELFEDDEVKYICLVCLEDFRKIDSCEHCGESSTGDMEKSGFFGCGQCEGSGFHD